MKKQNLATRIWQNKLFYCFLLPALLVITIFKYYPFLTSIYHSTFNWNGANVEIFTGMENYITLFHDKNFWTAMINISIVCLATIVINLIFPFLAAELVVNLRSEKKQEFFKLAFIIPMVVPFMVIILLWKWILAGETGVLNQLLKAVGLENLVTPWLGTPKTALASIIAINFPWISGLPFLIYLTGIQSISPDLYEAASLAGAKKFKQILYIDIPLLASQRKLVLTYMLIQAFATFEQVYVLTKGGPGTATLTPGVYIYQRAFDYNQFGYSAAIGVVLFLVAVGITLLNQKIMKDNDTLD